jgi:hypothetical protein
VAVVSGHSRWANTVQPDQAIAVLQQSTNIAPASAALLKSALSFLKTDLVHAVTFATWQCSPRSVARHTSRFPKLELVITMQHCTQFGGDNFGSLIYRNAAQRAPDILEQCLPFYIAARILAFMFKATRLGEHRMKTILPMRQ